MAIHDGLNEPEECLVFYLSINETALDPRDRGQVDIARNVALLRIQDPALSCTQNQTHINSILVDCDANFPFSKIACSFDDDPPKPCEFISSLLLYITFFCFVRYPAHHYQPVALLFGSSLSHNHL